MSFIWTEVFLDLLAQPPHDGGRQCLFREQCLYAEAFDIRFLHNNPVASQAVIALANLENAAGLNLLDLLSRTKADATHWRIGHGMLSCRSAQ